MAEGTEEKAEYQVLLSENYALDTDSKNFILKERFAKRETKSKHSALTGEYGWKDLGYFHSLTHVGDYVTDKGLLREDEITEMRHYAEVVERLRDEIIELLNDCITVIKK